MSQSHNPPASSSALQMLAWCSCAIAVGLLSWRGAVLTDKASQRTLSPHPAGSLIETFVGPGNVRIASTIEGGFLVLLDGPPGPVEAGLQSQLTELIAPLGSQRAAPVFKQFPFADKLVFSPSVAMLIELFGLVALASLSAALAILLGRRGELDDRAHIQARSGEMGLPQIMATLADNVPAPPPYDPGPQPVPAKFLPPAPSRPATETDAVRFAKANPEVTANVIKRWIRARGFEE